MTFTATGPFPPRGVRVRSGSVMTRWYFNDADPECQCECGWIARGDSARDAFSAWLAHQAERHRL